MKTIIDLPDQLMTEVETLAAREQREISDLMAELVRAGIESRIQPVEQTEQQVRALQWLERWIKTGEEATRDAPTSPTATEILQADRNRLEPGE